MPKKFFKELEKTVQIMRCTSPWLVYSTKNPDDETEEQFKNTWERQLNLAESIKDKLVSKKTKEIIQKIGDSFNLELTKLAGIPRIIRNYYLGDIRLDDFPSFLSKEMEIDSNRSEQISKLVIDQIINDRSFEESYRGSLESIQIKDALNKLPALGEQLITSDRITLKNFPSPVRPSIKNWLADYNFVVGFAKKEGSIGRTNYLFHNINTQKLSSPDRQKLSYILKAFDENSPITVNRNSQQVIFPEIQPKPAPEPFAPPRPFASPPPKKFDPGNNPPSGEKGGPDVRFTSPHKMPYEKEKDGGLQPYRITPFDTSPRDKAPEKDSQSAKNIINLKE